jgi:Zn-dependent peptidase ImmA (M78 family)
MYFVEKHLSNCYEKRANLVPRAFLVAARELRKTLVKYDEISKILGDLSHAQ